MKQKTLSTITYPTKAKALEALAPLQLKINGTEKYIDQQAPTFRLLVEKFIESERLREIKAQRPGEVREEGLHYSSAVSYLSCLEKHILPRWGDVLISQLKPLEVQDWLSRLTVTQKRKGEDSQIMSMAPKTKGHIKALMHRLFERAMLWGFIDLQRNPMGLVELRGVSKRRKKPAILTMEQCIALEKHLPQPYRTMTAVAVCLGLRVSEILALKWSDFDFDNLSVLVQRGIVHGRISDTKTEYSNDELPLAEGFAEVLEEWRAISLVSEEGWVFASPITGKPYHASTIQQDFLRLAGKQVNFKGELGWHTFRHTYRSWLDSTSAPIGVQQKLMRHAQVSTTMNVYGNALMTAKREANSKVVKMALRSA